MTRAILVSGLMLVLGLPAHGQSSAVPDVVGDRLDHAILALERAGFEVEHDGGAGYRETFSPLNTYSCRSEGTGKPYTFTQYIWYFRTVEATVPPAGTEVAPNSTVKVVSVPDQQSDSVPEECGSAH